MMGCNVPPPERVLPDPISGIAFVSDRSGNWDIYLVAPNGEGVNQLTDHPSVDADPDWSADGRQIVFRSRRDGSSDIFVMDADGSQPINLINDPADSFDDEFAPNGTRTGTPSPFIPTDFPHVEVVMTRSINWPYCA